MDDKRHLLFKLGISESDLGMLSRHSEGADQGPLTVSSGMLGYGRPDPGGVSYGDYQLTSQYIDAKGRVHPGQVREFLDSREGRPFKDHFKDERGHDLKPGSAAFTEAWKSVQDVEAFGQAQHAYIGSHFYNPQFDRACKAGIDTDRCSDTLKNVIWSTAVQHGANSTVITDGLKAEAAEQGKHVSALTDAECIKGIYQARAKANHNTPKLYSKEEGEALQMLKHEIEAKAHDTVSQRPASGPTHGGLVPTPHTLSTELSQRADAGLDTAPVKTGLDQGLTPTPQTLSTELSDPANAGLSAASALTGLVPGVTPGSAGLPNTPHALTPGQKPQAPEDGPQGKKPHDGGGLADFNPLVTPRM